MRPLRGRLAGGPAAADRGLPGRRARAGSAGAVARTVGTGAGVSPPERRAADAGGISGAGSRSTRGDRRRLPRRATRAPGPIERPTGGPAEGRGRPQSALRHPGPAEQLHRPRRPAGRLQRLGRRQGPVPGPDPPRPRGARRRPPRAAGGAGRRAPQAARRRPRAEPGRAQLARLGPRGPGASRRPRPSGQPGSRRRRPPGRATIPTPRSTYVHGAASSSGGAVPHPPVPRPGRPGRGLRRPRRGAAAARWRSRRSRTDYADDPRSRSRFVLEAEITGGLEHPGIVPVYGLGHYADGRPFYAMRFIKGDSLKEAIERFHTATRRRAATRASGRWSSASCWAGSSTSATRWPMRTAAACCTAT